VQHEQFGRESRRAIAERREALVERRGGPVEQRRYEVIFGTRRGRLTGGRRSHVAGNGVIWIDQ
jgi:hypothetical protein